jgi:hypothetical protein
MGNPCERKSNQSQVTRKLFPGLLYLKEVIVDTDIIQAPDSLCYSLPEQVFHPLISTAAKIVFPS